MKNKVGTIVVAVGALLVILGLFLPFRSMSSEILDKLSASGVDAAAMGGDSVNLFTPLTIIWIVAALGAVVFALLGNKIVTLITALVAGGGMLLSFFVNSGGEEVDMINSLGSLVGISGDIMPKGLGYWCALIGGIVMIIAGVIYFITTKSDKAEA